MNEDQFNALVDLMKAIAHEATGNAIHQPRRKGIVEDAEEEARRAFGLETN